MPENAGWALPEPKCDHICLKDDGHVERGEPHFYGYESPSPRRQDAEYERPGGCICVIPGGHPYGYDCQANGEVIWRINPDCSYHKAAAERPWDHSIPWNCPTYYDGCNCKAEWKKAKHFDGSPSGSEEQS